MCDTFVAVSGTKAGGVWFGKNSDREAGEAQFVEYLPAQTHEASGMVQCTHMAIPQAPQTYAVFLSRPFWMWGAEMGCNEYGLAIGNEAVFTRVEVEDSGLTGMDLLRLALERTKTAEEAMDLITSLIGRYGQGGRCGYRQAGFRYHNAFILADPKEAWVLETAGRYWVAEKVRSQRSISNVLSIGREFDRIAEGTIDYAQKRGWCKGKEDFDFARCFGSSLYRTLTGGDLRSACTLGILQRHDGKIDGAVCAEALRDHAGLPLSAGWRMKMPCAHASWWPTRHAGQTTASMISHLHTEGSQHWFTGTSSPCTSVFKPVVFDGKAWDDQPRPAEGCDAESLFWRHERLHRLVLEDATARRPVFEAERAALEAQCFGDIRNTEATDWRALWQKHRSVLPAWLEQVSHVGKTRWSGLYRWFWERENRREKMPHSQNSAL